MTTIWHLPSQNTYKVYLRGVEELLLGIRTCRTIWRRGKRNPISNTMEDNTRKQVDEEAQKQDLPGDRVLANT